MRGRGVTRHWTRSNTPMKDGGQSGSMGIVMPSSRPTRTGDRCRPVLVADTVEHPVDRRRLGERQAQLHHVGVVEPAEAQPEQRAAVTINALTGAAEQSAGDDHHDRRLVGGADERVRPGVRVKSSKRSRSTHACGRPGRRPASGGRPGRPGRSARRRSPRRTAGAGRARAASRSSRRRRPTTHRPRIAVVGQRVQVPTGCPTEHRRPAPRSPSSATSPTVSMPRRVQLLGGDLAPTPHSRSTGSGCRNASSSSAGTTSSPSGLATPLATLARNLVRATPTRDRQADPLAHLARAAGRAISAGVPGTVRAARRRRGTPRRSTCPRRAAWCRRRPRTPPCWPPSRPTCAAATTTASGHSRRACRPPIAVRTPHAFAS